MRVETVHRHVVGVILFHNIYYANYGQVETRADADGQPKRCTLMSMSRRTRRTVSGVVVAAVLGWLVLASGLLFPHLWALRPLDLSTPDQWFINWRLAAIRKDRDLCRAVLAPPHVVSSPVPDAVASEGCGWQNSERVISIAGARVSVDKLTCELTAGLSLWMIHEVQPEALRLFGHKVAEVHHVGGYACRNIDGSSGERSEHAAANALDITAFTFANGKRISILRGWPTDGADGTFLRHIHARACRYFPVALGPAYNAAHRDHFHYDRGAARKCK